MKPKPLGRCFTISGETRMLNSESRTCDYRPGSLSIALITITRFHFPFRFLAAVRSEGSLHTIHVFEPPRCGSLRERFAAPRFDEVPLG